MELGGEWLMRGPFAESSLLRRVLRRVRDLHGARRVEPILLAAALLLLVIAAEGCSASSALVGEWHVSGASQKMVEFTNDGKFDSTCLGMPAGTFRVTDDGKAIEFKGTGKTVTLTYSMAGGRMDLAGSLSDGTHVQWAMTRAASGVRPVK